MTTISKSSLFVVNTDTELAGEEPFAASDKGLLFFFVFCVNGITIRNSKRIEFELLFEFEMFFMQFCNTLSREIIYLLWPILNEM